MSLTGFNLRRRRLAKVEVETKKESVTEKVAEEKKVEEVKTETTETSATKVVHKKTTKK